MHLDEDIRARLLELEQKGLRRRIPAIEGRSGVTYRLGGRTVIGFCSNDYLGLHDDPIETDDTIHAAGSSGSRLISGDAPALRALELAAAQLLQTPAALYFPSGYQANVSILPALLRPTDIAYSDAANHASLIDGLRLAAARKQIVPHLASPPATSSHAADAHHEHGASWWILESRYSMDGDAPQPEAIRHFAATGGRVYLDEAHSIGLHAGGRGWADAHALRPQVRLATFGKAFGFTGAAVGASQDVIDWLANRARGFVFSTGPSPSLCDALRRRIEQVRGSIGDQRRRRLRRNIAQFAERSGLAIPDGSPIVPLHLGDNASAVASSRALLDAGFHVQAIRPPTVPEGTARLRITISAAHRPEHIDALVDVLRHLDLLPVQRPPHVQAARPASS